MDSETSVKLMNWIHSKFDSSHKYDPVKGHFLHPICIDGHRSLTSFIKFTKVEFNYTDSDDDLLTRFKRFMKILSSDDNCLILASLESMITNSNYGLILNRVKSSLATLKLIYKPPRKDQPKGALRISVNQGQTILEVLETLLVPNLNFVNHFEFLISLQYANIYAAIWLVAEAIKKSNLVSVSVNIRLITDKIIYPPTLALVFDDSDIFSCVDRLLDMYSSLSSIHRKIDIWVQQSVKTKFVQRIESKMAKSEELKVFIECLQTDAINPILAQSDNPDECFIKLLTFRKVDELLSIIKRYQVIRGASLWTSNVSGAYEITKEITNCQLFTINTIDDCPSSEDHSVLSYSKIEYKLMGEPTFNSCVPISFYAPTVDGVNVAKMPMKGHKNFLGLTMEDRFNEIASILSKIEGITPQAIDLLQQTRLNHSSFKTINKCLKLRELCPIGIVSVHFDKMESFTDHSLILGLIGCILLHGNCCLVVAVELPETIKQFLDRFNSFYPSSIFVASPSTPKPSIPFGWLVRDSDIIGLSFGLHHLTDLIGLTDCTSMFARTRSVYIPVEDQLRLTTSTASGY